MFFYLKTASMAKDWAAHNVGQQHLIKCHCRPQAKSTFDAFGVQLSLKVNHSSTVVNTTNREWN